LRCGIWFRVWGLRCSVWVWADWPVPRRAERDCRLVHRHDLFWVSDFGFRASVFTFRVSVSGFGCRVSGTGRTLCASSASCCPSSSCPKFSFSGGPFLLLVLVWGFEFGVWSLRFIVVLNPNPHPGAVVPTSSGFRVPGLGLSCARYPGSGFRVLDLILGLQGVGRRV
jgi:hypothetical protein